MKHAIHVRVRWFANSCSYKSNPPPQPPWRSSPYGLLSLLPSTLDLLLLLRLFRFVSFDSGTEKLIITLSPPRRTPICSSFNRFLTIFNLRPLPLLGSLQSLIPIRIVCIRTLSGSNTVGASSNHNSTTRPRGSCDRRSRRWTCHIQGPVDEYDYEPHRLDLGILNALKDSQTRAQPGPCNVCCAPCSLCLYFNLSSTVMESNLESGPSVNISSRKEDNCSSVADSIVKNGAQDKNRNVNSKTSNSLSSSTSHDSSVENAESKETFPSSETHNAFDVVTSPKVILNTVEDNKSPQEQTASTGGSFFSSDGSKPSVYGDEKASDSSDENHREKCHMKNNSNIVGFKDSNSAIRDNPGELSEKIVGCDSRSTGRLAFKNEGNAIQKDNAYVHNVTEISENQTEAKGNGKFSLKSSTTTSLNDDILYHNTDGIEDPKSCSNNSPKAQFTCSASPKQCLSHYSVDNENSPMNGKLFVGGVDEKNNSVTCEVRKKDSGKSQSPLHSPKGANESLGIENDDSKFESHVDRKCSGGNIKLSAIPVSNSLVTRVPLQPNHDCEASAEIEDDVKVCDICGDAGQEELLAICSRCSDGAEHTYCMRAMLDKVPEGEWLCEECQLKEAVDEVTEKSETQFELEAIQEPTVDESSQDVESTLKTSSSLEEKAIDSDITKGPKELIYASAKRSDSSQVNSVFKEKIDEACGASSGTTIPMTLASHDSVKVDIVNVQLTSPITTCGHSNGISQSTACPQTTIDVDSSKLRSRVETWKGSLSKSVSFNNSKVPKVKQLLENVPQKPKFTRESNLRSTKGVSKTITKSSSFRSETSGFRIAGTGNKAQELNSLQTEDPKGVKLVKDGSTVDKKNSSSDNCFSSTALSATTFSSLKTDSKAQQYDAKVKRISPSSSLAEHRGSNDATTLSNEVKKQPSASLLRNSPTTSLVRSSKNEDQMPFQPVYKSAEYKNWDEKTDNSFLGNSSQATSVSNQSSRCYKYNELGHATQFCSVDKLRMTATKLSSERNLKDMDNRTSKWKSVVKGWSGKSGTKTTAKSPDQSEEVSLSSADANSETSKDFASSSRNLTSTEGAEDADDFCKATNDVHVNKGVGVHKKYVFLTKRDSTFSSADDLPTKPYMQNLPDQDSVLMNKLRASVIPELDYIWQGAFEVLRSAMPPVHFDGFQAHLSAHVSPKALEVAKQFPCKVLLEEVPRLSSWPLQFHENSPKENNIAIFFFAKDINSYENYYWKLLDNMRTNDLTLVGNIDAVELLIFPSNLLPESSQRWNRLLFLWGVFRGREKNCSEGLATLEKRSCVSKLNMKANVHDLSTHIVSGLCNLPLPDICSEGLATLEKRSCVSKLNMKANVHDLSTHIVSGLCNLPLPDISESVVGITSGEQPPSERNLRHSIADGEVLKKHVSCSLSAGGYRNLYDVTAIPVSHPEPRVQIDIEQLPSEMEVDLNSLDNLGNDSDSGKDSCLHAASARLSNCWLGNEKNVQKIKRQHTEVDLDEQLSDKSAKVDRLIWESKSNPGHPQHSSVEAIKSSDHLLRPSVDTMLWTDELVCTSLSSEKECKRMRLDNGGFADCKSSEATLSSKLFSKVPPILSGSINSSVFHEAVPRSSKNVERHFFLNDFDFVPTSSSKAKNLMHALSSDRQDLLDSNTPDLELALGEKRRLIKHDILQISSPKDRDETKRDKLPAPAGDDGDDTLASLSLSLAFPSSGKTKPAKPNSDAEQLLLDKPCISTSLLLFGGYRET